MCIAGAAPSHSDTADVTGSIPVSKSVALLIRQYVMLVV
jgi:hypothetical protein